MSLCGPPLLLPRAVVDHGPGVECQFGGSGQVRTYLAEFTARTAEIKGVSIGFVVFTAVMLVAQVEREINAVWGISTARFFMRRVVGPVSESLANETKYRVEQWRLVAVN